MFTKISKTLVVPIKSEKLDPICSNEAETQSTEKNQIDPKPVSMPRLNSRERFKPKALAPSLYERRLRKRFLSNPYMKTSSELSLQLMMHKHGKSIRYAPAAENSLFSRFFNKKDDDCLYFYSVYTPTHGLHPSQCVQSRPTKLQTIVVSLRDWWSFR